MPNTLRFYQDFTPNLGRGDHFYFDDIDDYLNAISSHLFGYIETLDNYRISSLVLRLPYPIQYDEQTGDFAHFENITYIAEYDERIQLWRFYHVKSFTYLSNYIDFNLSRDLWADFIAKASLDNIFLQRANRLPMGYVGGRYDNVEFTKTKATSAITYLNFMPLDDDPQNLDNVYICFTIVYQTYKEKTLFGGTITTSSCATYCIRPIDYATADGVTPYNYAYIDYMIERIAAIYGVKVGNDHNDAYVKNIYIVPSNFIPVRTNPNNEFLTVGHVNISGTAGLKVVEPCISNIAFEITQKQDSMLYFGTPTAMLELPRTIDITAVIECIAKVDDIQIIARCGDNQLDITQSFSVGLPTTQGEADQMEKVARGISTVGALVGAGANIAAGNYIGGGLSIANALVPHDKTPNAQYKNNGDGLSSWKKWSIPLSTSDYNIRYPIGITEYPSIDGAREIANVTKYGAIYNAYFDTLAEIIGGNALTTDVAASHTYVKATIDVENVPLDAGDYIAQEFANGLEIIEL